MNSLRPRVLVVSSEYPDPDHPVSATFVRDQAQIAAMDCEVAVLVATVAGWRCILSPRRRPGVRVANEAGLTVCRSTKWHPPLRPRWLARALLRPPTEADDRPHVPERFLDVLLPTFLGAGQGGLSALLSSWGEPDLVHAHFVFPGGWVGRHLALQLARPLILTEHSSRLEDQTATVLRRRLAGEVYRSAARVIAVSPFQAQQIRGIEPTTDVTVISNPVDTAFFSPEKQPELRRPGTRFHFLSIAHLKPRKGLDVLLGAARILVDRGRCDFDITIGGEGPERTRLEAEVARLGLGDRARFAGRLMPIEVRDAMRGCDAFVLASRRESFGLVLAEAISCGRPVVTTRSGGAEFVVTEESGILVAVDDPTALAEAMDNLISRRIHFDSDSLHREAVRRFSRETYRQSLRRVYLEALP